MAIPDTAVHSYRPDQRFFDDVVILLTTLGSFGMSGAIAVQDVPLEALRDPTNQLAVAGKAHVSNRKFVFRPFEILSEIWADRWPTEISYIVELGAARNPNVTARYDAWVRINNLHRLQIASTEAAFLHYFETHLGFVARPLPRVWKFARVIRNACAHGGRIDIRDKNAMPVSWMSLSYSAADNGKEIWKTDLTTVEALLLMEEMDVAF